MKAIEPAPGISNAIQVLISAFGSGSKPLNTNSWTLSRIVLPFSTNSGQSQIKPKQSTQAMPRVKASGFRRYFRIMTIHLAQANVGADD